LAAFVYTARFGESGPVAAPFLNDMIRLILPIAEITRVAQLRLVAFAI
jgi:hypothetical protein